MTDFVDIMNGKREGRLSQDIRKELRYGKQYTFVIAGLALLVVGAVFSGKFDSKDMNYLLLCFPVAALAAARIPQRERLLQEAAEKLAEQEQ